MTFANIPSELKPLGLENSDATSSIAIVAGRRVGNEDQSLTCPWKGLQSLSCQRPAWERAKATGSSVV